MDHLHIPNRYLKARRIAAGFLRREEFADAIGLSDRQLKRIEDGQFIGGLRHYVLGARLLGCSVDDLVPDTLRSAPVPWTRKEWLLRDREQGAAIAPAQMPSMLRFPPT